ncbi:transcription factor grauzone-like isoform X2 [Musca autumnalis]|uniref:transcription factor grauzone-like isoform X2 n=1 Tax=Musca autumnalis TaxID=221902 RepID=UPI003CECF4F0
MDYTKVCRLCVNTFEEGKPLYDENGQANIRHEITCKYFHPQIANMFEARYLSSICSQCWRTISEFHSFEAAVQLAQLKLLDLVTPKLENEAVNINHESMKQIPNSFQAHETLLQRTDGNNSERDTSKRIERMLTTTTDISKENIGSSADINIQHKEPMAVTNTTTTHTTTSASSTKPSEQPIEVITIDSDNEEPDFTYNVGKHSKRAKRFKGSQQIDVSPAIANPQNWKTKSNETVMQFVEKWLPKIKCGICQTACPNIETLEKHFEVHHPDKAIYIVCCSRLISLRMAREHALLHKNPNTFRCNMCHKRYGGAGSLKLHVAKVHPEHIQYHCKLCGHKNTSYKEQLNHYSKKHSTGKPVENVKHTNGRTKYPCHLCDNMAASELAYYHHYWFKHGRLYYCNACDRQYSSLKHSCPAALNVKQTPSSTVKEFDCHDCANSYDTEREIVEHLAFEHRQINLYNCPCCPETFNAVTKIPKHRKKLHPNEPKMEYYKNMDDRFNMLLQEYLAKRKSTYREYVGNLIRIRDRRRFRGTAAETSNDQTSRIVQQNNTSVHNTSAMLQQKDNSNDSDMTMHDAAPSS